VDTERWERIRQNFQNENLIRVSAVDGDCFSAGNSWDDDIKKMIVGRGDMSEDAKMSPWEFGCMASHRKTWKKIINDNTDSAIVLEDDCVKVNKRISLSEINFMCKDADVVFLSGENTNHMTADGEYHSTLSIDCDGRVLRAHGTYAYMITKAGAENALEATSVASLPLTAQWFPRSFLGYQRIRYDSMPGNNQVVAVGQKKAIIRTIGNTTMKSKYYSVKKNA
jgi:GR25 family glycosyltransferase involved in LPS biosynthesis